MTYWRYWQLEGAPFAGEQEQVLFRGGSVEEALARIEFLVSNRRSVGALIGSSGVGKSSIFRYCSDNPPVTREVPTVKVLRQSMLGLDAGDLISNITGALTGIRFHRRSADSATINGQAWQTLCDYFQAASREGTQTVLMIDDTESCSAAAELDMVRLLSVTWPMTIVFAADAQLTGTISRHLIERTELQIDLPDWDVTQTAEFLNWTMSRLGRFQPIFTDEALERIHNLSSGVVRRIIQIADLALVAGAVAALECIDEGCIDQVAWELPKSRAA